MMHFAFSNTILLWSMGAWRSVNYTMIIKKLRQRCMKIFTSIIRPKNTKRSIKLSLYFHIKLFENWVQFRPYFHKIKIGDSRIIINKNDKISKSQQWRSVYWTPNIRMNQMKRTTNTTLTPRGKRHPSMFTQLTCFTL